MHPLRKKPSIRWDRSSRRPHPSPSRCNSTRSCSPPTPSATLSDTVISLLTDTILKKWGSTIATTSGKVGNAVGHLIRLVEACSIKEADAETTAYLDVTKQKWGDMSTGTNFARLGFLSFLPQAPEAVAAIVRGDTAAGTDAELYVAQVTIATMLGPLASHKMHDKACVIQGDHVTVSMAVHVLMQTTYGKDLTSAINSGRLTSTVACQGELPPKKRPNTGQSPF